jgi:tetratricopeptide (TPR) repeat protein/TolB-like protein
MRDMVSLPVQIGQVIGHYRVIEQIGAGAMGVVYRACDERLQRDVALKVLSLGLAADASARKRFRNEALCLSRLNHPNIEQVFDFHSELGIDYLVMEYVSGMSLDERLRQGAFSEQQAINISGQLARGLISAHGQKIIHRDLKPGNLRLTPENLLKILDFGLAQLFLTPAQAADAETLTRLHAFGGTLPYMAPEQLLGGEPSIQSDLYSSGAVIYELLTARRLFSQSGSDFMDAKLHNKLPKAAELRKQVSPSLVSVIFKCLETDPDRRYQSATELLGDLEYLENGTHFGSRLAPLGSSVASIKRTALFICSVLAVALLTVFLFFRDGISSRFVRQPFIPAHKLIVILPFRIDGALSDDKALYDGLTDIVTNRLMRLTAAQSVAIVPAGEVSAIHVRNMDEARKELGASLVIDGSVQSRGGELRVDLGLSDAIARRQLRAESVSGQPSDFKGFQEQIVNAALSMLELELHAGPSQATTSSDAFVSFTRGLGYFSKTAPENADSAIFQLTRALQLDPGYAEAYAWMGRAYARKYELTKDKQWVSKLTDACDQSLKLRPDLVEGHICKGILHNITGRYQDAASDFLLALDADPTNDDAYQHLASAYEQLGRLALAERTIQKAIALRPENPQGYTRLGALYAREAQYDSAAHQFEKALSLAPDRAQDWSSLGGVYLVGGKYPEAESALLRAINMQPSYEAYSNLGQAYFFQRRFDEAIESFEQSVALGGRQFQAYGNLARAYYWYPRTKRKAEPTLVRAIDIAEEDLRVNPDDADVHTSLAEYFAMLGNRTQAIRHLQAALRSRPNDPETEYFAAKTYNVLGDRDQSLAWLDKAVGAGYSSAEINHTVELDSLRKDRRFPNIRPSR